jgi:formamidopyrimidine-DNA glycosylase
VPELPDVVIYVESLERHIAGAVLENVRLASPFVLRTVDPPIATIIGSRVLGVERLGKRIAIALEHDRFLVLHLMIAGRLRWREPRAKIPGRLGLVAFDFAAGSLLLTEAGSKKRAALHVVQGRDALAALAPVGLEVLEADLDDFRAVISRERHTLKRTLTDPRLLSGIGNAYSDEILHRARLSPVRLSDQLEDGEIARLFDACRATLVEWTERLRADVGTTGFPDKVTAFRPEMSVHGRYRLPCPVCGTPVQRIVHAENETNYCPRCQTGGKLLADRALSRLLHDDWPRTIEEWEAGPQASRRKRR